MTSVAGRLGGVLDLALWWGDKSLARTVLASAAYQDVQIDRVAECVQRWPDVAPGWIEPTPSLSRQLGDIAGRLHIEAARLNHLAGATVASARQVAQGIAAEVTRSAMAVRGLSRPPTATEKALGLPVLNRAELQAAAALPKHLEVPT